MIYLKPDTIVQCSVCLAEGPISQGSVIYYITSTAFLFQVPNEVHMEVPEPSFIFIYFFDDVQKKQ